MVNNLCLACNLPITSTSGVLCDICNEAETIRSSMQNMILEFDGFSNLGGNGERLVIEFNEELKGVPHLLEYLWVGA